MNDWQALELDISKQLAAYEVEYHMMQEEVVASIASAPASPKIHDEQSRFQSMQLQESNANLQKQVRDLQAQVQQAERKANLLEVTLKESQITQAKSERQVTYTNQSDSRNNNPIFNHSHHTIIVLILSPSSLVSNHNKCWINFRIVFFISLIFRCY